MTAGTVPWSLIARGGLDLVVVVVLVGWLYRRGRPMPQMPLVLTALNVGLFAAMSAMSEGRFPAGVGFGLFGMLSLVRLRSTAFTARDVAYTFVALVIALCSGLPQRDLLFTAVVDFLVLAAVAAVDDLPARRPLRVLRVTLDRVYTDDAAVRREIARRFGRLPLAVVLDEVDCVRETTRVLVHYHDDGQPALPASQDETSLETQTGLLGGRQV